MDAKDPPPTAAKATTLSPPASASQVAGLKVCPYVWLNLIIKLHCISFIYLLTQSSQNSFFELVLVFSLPDLPAFLCPSPLLSLLPSLYSHHLFPKVQIKSTCFCLFFSQLKSCISNNYTQNTLTFTINCTLVLQYLTRNDSWFLIIYNIVQ